MLFGLLDDDDRDESILDESVFTEVIRVVINLLMSGAADGDCERDGGLLGARPVGEFDRAGRLPAGEDDLPRERLGEGDDGRWRLSCALVMGEAGLR